LNVHSEKDLVFFSTRQSQRLGRTLLLL